MPLLGLIGFPLSHSFSPRFFMSKFERLGLHDWDYRLFPIEHISELPQLIENHKDLVALNVTIPHKQHVLRFCGTLSDEAAAIGASNLITIKRNGHLNELKAYNTDYYGFTESISDWYRQIHGKALVLGTGGASKAIQYALKQLNIDFDVAGRSGPLTYQNIRLSSYQLIINCTPVGMYRENGSPEECLPLHYEDVRRDHHFYDLVYNPEYTVMMRKFEEKGARVKNGLQMLYLQAERAWTIINS